MSFGSNIKRFRRDKGMTQGELSELCGMKLGHLSKIERDETDPKLSTIYKIMNALNCSPDSLFMDPEKVGIDGVLKASLERAASLPEENKRVLIDVIDKYCIAVGFRAQFVDEENSKFLWWKGGPKPMLSELDKEKNNG